MNEERVVLVQGKPLLSVFRGNGSRLAAVTGQACTPVAAERLFLEKSLSIVSDGNGFFGIAFLNVSVLCQKTPARSSLRLFALRAAGQSKCCRCDEDDC